MASIPPKVPDIHPDLTSSDVRDELINTAVKFLSNPKVQASTIEQREAFLRNKGLTEREIRISFERSVPLQNGPVYPPHTAIPMGLQGPPGYHLLPQQTRWSRFRDFINTVAIVGGLAYGLYILYKRYVAPYLFGTSKKRSPLEESISSLDRTLKSSVQELRTDLQKVQSDLEKINEQQSLSQTSAVERQVRDVKSEIASLKGILLNRQQFPAMDELTPTVPWIPDWQKELEELERTADKDESEQVKPTDDATPTNEEPTKTNGSDSSLEIEVLRD